MNADLSPFQRGIARRTRQWNALQARTVTLTHEHPPAPRDIATVTRGFDRPLSHAESFTEPLELASGLANANIAVSADGKPLHGRDGKVCKIIDNLPELNPGTFGKVKGKLIKSSTRSSLNNLRWNNSSTAARAHKFNPSCYRHTPTVKQMEHAATAKGDAEQKRRLAEYFAARS